jgi:hypothetical protein
LLESNIEVRRLQRESNLKLKNSQGSKIAVLEFYAGFVVSFYKIRED